MDVGINYRGKYIYVELMKMAKMRGPRFKKCRSLGLNVCGHPKAMDRAGKWTSRADKKLSDYGKQLLEKQRLRAYYGVMEKQFRRHVKGAAKSSEVTSEALVKRLETRLDNLVYRLGFASSIRQARQMVVHGHMHVNGKKVDIPSFGVGVDDVITLREKSRTTEMFKDNFQNSDVAGLPYLSKDVNTFSGGLLREPTRKEIPIQIDDHLVVEFYSRLL